jgi:crescentin
MSSGWTSFRSRFGKKQDETATGSLFEGSEPVDATAVSVAPPEKGETIVVRPNATLDTVGQKNELIRVRFANMIDRLEEIRSLKEDFALLRSR